MNWEAIGAAGEILGAIAVFVTLAYLATQIRQANELSRFNGSKEVVNQFNDLNRMVATDSDLRQVLTETGDLSASEREQIYTYAMMFCGVYVSVQTAYDNGQIEGWLYAAAAKDVRVEMERWPHFRWAIERWLENYPENSHHEIFRPVLERGGP